MLFRYYMSREILALLIFAEFRVHSCPLTPLPTTGTGLRGEKCTC
jgi:hypothetical protein